MTTMRKILGRQLMFPIFCVLLFVMCSGLDDAVAQEAKAPAKPQQPITVKSDQNTDIAIANRIRTLFASIKELRSIIVSVNAGVVTLSGSVLEQKTIAEANRLASRVQGVVKVENNVKQSNDVAERLVPIVDRLGSRSQQFLAYLPLLGVAVVIFFLITVIGWLVSRRQQPFTRLAPNQFIANLYRQITMIVFVVIGLVVALDILDASALLGAILGTAGILGLAFGFAIKDTIENYIASILLSLRQPFRPNDLIDVEGKLGNVIRLTSRATIIMTADGNQVRIPNATVLKGMIINYTARPERRLAFDLGVDAESNLKDAAAVVTEALRKLDFILSDPLPEVLVSEIGDSNVIITSTAWIDQNETDFTRARSECIRIAKVALESRGFGMPEPIYRLKIDDPAGTVSAGGLKSQVGPSSRHAPIDAHIVEDEIPADTSVDDTITKKVIADRAKAKDTDFLDERAPVE